MTGLWRGIFHTEVESYFLADFQQIADLLVVDKNPALKCSILIFERLKERSDAYRSNGY